MKKELTLALIQWDVRDGDPDFNVARVTKWAERCRDQGADLVLIPEMWYVGYDYECFSRFATGLSQGGFSVLSKIAAQLNLAICGTSVRREGERFFNTMTCYDPKGELLFAYDKLYLFAPMGESEHFQPGNQVVFAQWQGWKVGAAICYDLRFPELFRQQSGEGVKLYLICAQWPETRIEHWHLLLRARAIENQAFVAGCNRVGHYKSYTFPGQSAIIAPDGRVLIRADTTEGVWKATIHMDRLVEYRRQLPFLGDRRKDLIG